MTSTATPPPLIPARAQSVALLPGERFFVRRIPLTPGQDAALQVELALETFGPFSPAQIFHGFCTSRDGKQALLFAAYRKNFTAEEIASWASAEIVLPEFALWLALAVPPAAGVWLYENNDVLQLIAWDGSELPAGLLFRKSDHLPAEIAAGELLDEAAKRFGVPTGSPRRLGGNFAVEKWSKEGLSLKLDKPGQTMTTLLPVAMARSMDVRDKAELAGLAQQQKRSQWLWRAFAGIAAALVLCAVAEIGVQVAGKFLEKYQQVVKANAGAVQQIEQANKLAARMEHMAGAGQQLKLIGMLSSINNLRPKLNSFTFNRLTISSPVEMELDAQTNNAADLSDFVQALKKSPEIDSEKVVVRDQRVRDGVTTFQLQVGFKPGFPVEGDVK